MKKLIVLAIALFSIGQAAHATSIKRYLGASLIQFNFHAESELSRKGIDKGAVDIDFVKRNVRIMLYKDTKCPKGMMCPLAAVMPVFMTYEAQLKRVSTDECNAVTYLARDNKLMVDGLDIQIRVTDNSQNTCPTVAVWPPQYTVVELKVQFPFSSARESHRFVGEALQ